MSSTTKAPRRRSITPAARKRIVQLHTEHGLGLYAIATKLAAEGVKTARGGRWSEGTVRYVLIREGVYRPRAQSRPLTLDEILAKTRLDPATGCRLWTASVRGQYGAIRRGTRMLSAHRVVFGLMHPEEDIDGLLLHHLCREKLCVRPEHLLAVRDENDHKLQHRFEDELQAAVADGTLAEQLQAAAGDDDPEADRQAAAEQAVANADPLARWWPAALVFAEQEGLTLDELAEVIEIAEAEAQVAA